MSVEAMKQALEAWQTSVYGSESHHKAMLIAMTNMSQAIEQAEKQEPVAYLHDVVADDGEPDQALSFSPITFPLGGVGGFKSVRMQPLYLRNEWIGLTTDERVELMQKIPHLTIGGLLAVEAKLKERNHVN